MKDKPNKHDDCNCGKVVKKTSPVRKNSSAIKVKVKKRIRKSI